MQRRILFTVGIVVVGFLFVMGVVTWQMKGLQTTLDGVRGECTPLYVDALTLNSTVERLNTEVAEAFMVKGSTEFSIQERNVKQQEQELLALIQKMNAVSYAPSMKSVEAVVAPKAEAAATSGTPPQEK